MAWFGFGDNKEKDKSKSPSLQRPKANSGTVDAIKKAKGVRGGSALDKRMCNAGFKKHCK